MNHVPPPAGPSASGRSAPDADPVLRAALQSLPPDVDAAQLEALQQRVLAQWRAQVAPVALPARHRASEAGWLGLGGHGAALRGPGGVPSGGAGRWFGVALAIVAVVGALLWWQRPDPVLEELLRVDVLSQMAAGEM